MIASVCNRGSVKHVGCKFFANFGSRRMDKAIVLKRCCLEHQGITREPLAKDGRRWKKRRKLFVKGNLITRLTEFSSVLV
jgi:hypothetical protein